MKILLISASPRGTKSTSTFLLNGLFQKLDDKDNTKLLVTSQINEEDLKDELEKQLKDCENLVFAFPLYVDGLPSNLLSVLEKIEKTECNKEGITVYGICNNGFFDAKQNHIALEMLYNFADKVKMNKGSSIAIAGGGMVQVSPLGYGPSKNIGKAVDKLAYEIKVNKSEDKRIINDVYPNFPKFLYTLAATNGFKKHAHDNGLTNAQIKSKA